MRLRAVVVFLSLLAAMAAGAELKAPSVNVQAVLRRPAIEADDPATAKIPMTLVVTNASERPLTHLSLAVDPASGFTAIVKPSFPTTLAPFSTFVGSFELAPRQKFEFGKHNVVLTVQYQWDDATTYTSAQSVTTVVEFRRLLEDEAKALPGGTPALFFLLLPLIPALFAYQIVDRLRRGEGLQFPVFESDYLFPACCIGLLVNYVIGTRYLRALVLIVAAAVGAVWPALRWAWESYQRRRWGFRKSDDPQTYLRKALLSPRRHHGASWVTAKAGGEIWSGALLEQPDGHPVLGMRLQVSPVQSGNANEDKSRADRLTVLADATAGTATRKQRSDLYTEVEQGRATVKAHEVVIRNGGQHAEIIVAEELVGFERQKVERKKFVEFVQ